MAEFIKRTGERVSRKETTGEFKARMKKARIERRGLGKAEKRRAKKAGKTKEDILKELEAKTAAASKVRAEKISQAKKQVTVQKLAVKEKVLTGPRKELIKDKPVSIKKEISDRVLIPSTAMIKKAEEIKPITLEQIKAEGYKPTPKGMITAAPEKEEKGFFKKVVGAVGKQFKKTFLAPKKGVAEVIAAPKEALEVVVTGRTPEGELIQGTFEEKAISGAEAFGTALGGATRIIASSARAVGTVGKGVATVFKGGKSVVLRTTEPIGKAITALSTKIGLGERTAATLSAIGRSGTILGVGDVLGKATVKGFKKGSAITMTKGERETFKINPEESQEAYKVGSKAEEKYRGELSAQGWGGKLQSFGQQLPGIPGINERDIPILKKLIIEPAAESRRRFKEEITNFYIEKGYGGQSLNNAVNAQMKLRESAYAGETTAFLGLNALTEIQGGIELGKLASRQAFKGLYVADDIGKAVIKYKGLKNALVTAAAIAPAGFVEGFVGERITQEARAEDKDLKKAAIVGVIGAGTAGLIGGTISGLKAAKKHGLSSLVDISAKIADPYEKPGDVIADYLRMVPTKKVDELIPSVKVPIVAPEVKVPTETFQAFGVTPSITKKTRPRAKPSPGEVIDTFTQFGTTPKVKKPPRIIKKRLPDIPVKAVTPVGVPVETLPISKGRIGVRTIITPTGKEITIPDVGIPVEISTEIPTEIPTKVPVQIITEVPTQLPIEVQPQVPVGVPTQVPTAIQPQVMVGLRGLPLVGGLPTRYAFGRGRKAIREKVITNPFANPAKFFAQQQNIIGEVKSNIMTPLQALGSGSQIKKQIIASKLGQNQILPISNKFDKFGAYIKQPSQQNFQQSINKQQSNNKLKNLLGTQNTKTIKNIKDLI